jgi:hypothetical protein
VHGTKVLWISYWGLAVGSSKSCGGVGYDGSARGEYCTVDTGSRYCGLTAVRMVDLMKEGCGSAAVIRVNKLTEVLWISCSD